MFWNGGEFGPATGPAVPHENLMTGQVAFDVTADVLYADRSAWLLKVDDERTDRNDDRGRRGRVPAGDESPHGVVEYHSIQGSTYFAGDDSLAPVLRFYY
jgi:hypothetical protein